MDFFTNNFTYKNQIHYLIHFCFCIFTVDVLETDWSASERCSVGIENKWNSSQTQDIYLPVHVEVSVVVIVSVEQQN
jgi:hypothetical protein